MGINLNMQINWAMSTDSFTSGYYVSAFKFFVFWFSLHVAVIMSCLVADSNDMQLKRGVTRSGHLQVLVIRVSTTSGCTTEVTNRHVLSAVRT
jgi:hypothetical protein